jgi:DNA-directed RNA polymerase specialized sigma24 family protein
MARQYELNTMQDISGGCFHDFRNEVEERSRYGSTIQEIADRMDMSPSLVRQVLKS